MAKKAPFTLTRERPSAPLYSPMDPISHGIVDAAKLVGISRSSIYELISAGRLDARKVAGRTVVTGASLRRLIEEAPAAPIRPRQC